MTTPDQSAEPEAKEPTSKDRTLRDLAEWIKRHLQTLHPRQNPSWYLVADKANGYAVAEIPDWEMRQKLNDIEEALK